MVHLLSSVYVCVCVCLWKGSNVISCTAILSACVLVTVILRKRAQPLNVYHRGTMARLIEACVPLWVCVHLSQHPPNPLFPASHRKGLFGFIVQDGLRAQLGHLYKFSLYGVLWCTCTRPPRCMTLLCSRTTLPFNPAPACGLHVYLGECLRIFVPNRSWTEPTPWGWA